MATAKKSYRKIDTSIWEDPYVLDLNIREKFFFCYLLTNSHTTQSGIYEIPLRKMEFETGLPGEDILSTINKFQNDGKMIYSIETREICVINWTKYNENKSPKTMIKVANELEDIKNPFLVLYLYDPRLPLYEGIKTLNRGTPKEKTEPYLIENPWKDMFKDLQDAELLEIRKVGKIDQDSLSKPSGYSMDTVSILHPPYTDTNTKTEHIQIHKQKQIQSGSNPFQSTQRQYSNEYETLRQHWNTLNLPECRKLAENLPNWGEIINSMQLYTLEEITQAVTNYCTLQPRQSAITYTTFPNFLIRGIEKYSDSSHPHEMFKESEDEKMSRFRKQSEIELGMVENEST